MNIFEAIGLAWVVFTSALASVAIMYLAFVGLRVVVRKDVKEESVNVPVEVKEMFKIAR